MEFNEIECDKIGMAIGYAVGAVSAMDAADYMCPYMYLENSGNRTLFVLVSSIGGALSGQYVVRNGIQSAKGLAVVAFLTSFVGFPLYQGYKRYQKNQKNQ